MNWGDLLVLAVLAVIVGGVVGNLLRKKKQGSGCGCTSCSGCAMAGSCQSRKE